jgi:hypothetical protein
MAALGSSGRAKGLRKQKGRHEAGLFIEAKSSEAKSSEAKSSEAKSSEAKSSEDQYFATTGPPKV